MVCPFQENRANSVILHFHRAASFLLYFVELCDAPWRMTPSSFLKVFRIDSYPGGGSKARDYRNSMRFGVRGSAFPLSLLCGTGKLYNSPGIVCYNTVVACGLVKPCTWLLGVVLDARKEIFCRNFMIFEGMPSRLQIWTIQDSNCSVWCQFFSVL